MSKIVLVDMDGVLADFNKELLKRFKERYPNKLQIPFEQLKTHNTEDNYEREDREIIRNIYHEPGFVKSLEPIPGGLEAIKEMSSRWDVVICTAFLKKYENCIGEKFEWIHNYLGNEWIKRMILTRDKTLVNGDYLIDDKPEQNGVCKPTWEHVLYSQPYNAQITDKRRLTWKNWKEILGFD